jgi:hypothetical protein
LQRKGSGGRRKKEAGKQAIIFKKLSDNSGSSKERRELTMARGRE